MRTFLVDATQKSGFGRAPLLIGCQIWHKQASLSRSKLTSYTISPVAYKRKDDEARAKNLDQLTAEAQKLVTGY